MIVPSKPPFFGDFPVPRWITTGGYTLPAVDFPKPEAVCSPAITRHHLAGKPPEDHLTGDPSSAGDG